MRRRAILLAAGLAMVTAACSAGEPPHATQPLCSRPNESMVLLAQTVQDATRLPCITGYPAGWSYGGYEFENGSGTYWLSSSIAGVDVVEVQLLASCRRVGEPFPVGIANVEGYRSTDASGETRRFLFEGGCVVQQISPSVAGDDLLLRQARDSLSFQDREALAAELERDYDVILCGAGAEPCVGA
jgi:hypothetical protein